MDLDAAAALTAVYDSTRDVAQASFSSGCMGSLLGASLATYRGHDVYMYSVGMGSNFFMIAAAILSFEKVASSVKGRSDVTTYGIGGALGGGLAAGVHAGRRAIILPACIIGVSTMGARASVERWLPSLLQQPTQPCPPPSQISSSRRTS